MKTTRANIGSPRDPEVFPPDQLLIAHEGISRRTYLKSIFSVSLQERLTIGRLTVEVVEAVNLPVADFGGSSDPYVNLELSGRFGTGPKNQREWVPELRTSARTHYESSTLNPVWNVKGIPFQLKRHGAVLKVRVFDHDDLATDDPLGHVVIYLNHMAPGEHDRWWPLCDPQEPQTLSTLSSFDPDASSAKTISGPAIRLRINFKIDPFGELVSYLWSPPKIVKPTPPQFDPNLFFSYMTIIKNKGINSISYCITAVTDAISWKRGPSYTFAVLGFALTVCEHIDSFWIILHAILAVTIAGTGIMTKCGSEPLLSSSLTIEPSHSTLDGDGLATVPDSPLVDAKKKKPNSRLIIKRPSSMSSPPIDVAAEEAHIELENSPHEVEKSKRFTGMVEITLRKVGRSFGSGLASTQEALRQATDVLAMLEGLILWERRDFKLGFGLLDGPVMATGFALGNLILAAIHCFVPLKYLATMAVLVMFFSSIFGHLSKLLPQGLKVRKARENMLLAEDILKERPAPINKTSIQGFAQILSGIFRRVDIDGSGTVTLDELLKSVPQLGEEDKDKFCFAFKKADDDDSGEINGREFERMVTAHRDIGGALVVAELKRRLRSDEGFREIKFLDEGTPKKRRSNGVYHLLPKTLRSHSQTCNLRIPHDSYDEQIVVCSHGNLTQTMKSSEIKAIAADGHSILDFELNLSHTPHSPSPTKLRFDLHHEMVRDALRVAILELLAEPCQPPPPVVHEAAKKATLTHRFAKTMIHQMRAKVNP